MVRSRNRDIGHIVSLTQIALATPTVVGVEAKEAGFTFLALSGLPPEFTQSQRARPPPFRPRRTC